MHRRTPWILEPLPQNVPAETQEIYQPKWPRLRRIIFRLQQEYIKDLTSKISTQLYGLTLNTFSWGTRPPLRSYHFRANVCAREYKRWFRSKTKKVERKNKRVKGRGPALTSHRGHPRPGLGRARSPKWRWRERHLCCYKVSPKVRWRQGVGCSVVQCSSCHLSLTVRTALSHHFRQFSKCLRLKLRWLVRLKCTSNESKELGDRRGTVKVQVAKYSQFLMRNCQQLWSMHSLPWIK